jgi:hypothetical protein
MRDAVAATTTTLTEVHGISTVLAAKLLGHVGDITRFPSADHFAGLPAPLLLLRRVARGHDIDSIPAAIGNSIPCCTPSRSAKPAIPARVASTASANSMNVRPRPKLDEHSNAALPTCCIAGCVEINKSHCLPLLDTQRRYHVTDIACSTFSVWWPASGWADGSFERHFGGQEFWVRPSRGLSSLFTGRL